MGRSAEQVAIVQREVSTLSAAQARIVADPLQLFAQQGVGGTSLQMIADAVGVTKAAVCFQFKTKDEIVLAAAEDEVRPAPSPSSTLRRRSPHLPPADVRCCSPASSICPSTAAGR